MEPNERRLRDLFAAARRADRAETPGMRNLLEREPDWRRPRRRSLVAATTLASVTLVAIAGWLYLESPQRRVTDLLSAPDERAETRGDSPDAGGMLDSDAFAVDRYEPESDTTPSGESGEVSEPAAAGEGTGTLQSLGHVSSGEIVPDATPGQVRITSRTPRYVAPSATGPTAETPDTRAGATAPAVAVVVVGDQRGEDPAAEPAEPKSTTTMDFVRRERTRNAPASPPPAPVEEAPTPAADEPVPSGNEESEGKRSAYRRLRTEMRRASGMLPAQIDSGDEAETFNTESYGAIVDNRFHDARNTPLSTFSIDVDTASYSNVRRFLRGGRLPPADAVRIEELLNYFDYDYPEPESGDAFSATVEIAGCPWNPAHRLARIGLRGREVDRHEVTGRNLVFLIDVSGSMRPPNKLPLLKRAMSMLAQNLDPDDMVAIVVYAGASGLVLPPTPGADTGAILGAIARLEAGGGTNGAGGIELAYRIARENFIPGGVNRVILATDGDFNLGVTDPGELVRLIEQDARDGIFLTTLGFGDGNYDDRRLELLSNRGNGNHAYIDTLREARKVLVEEMQGTLVTIAKDVKIQVEFNPAVVASYRLIGYANRKLAAEDFNDDRKDAGEIGAGHTVTALYEIVPVGVAGVVPPVDPLKYQRRSSVSDAVMQGETMTLKLRYKEPHGSDSRLLLFPVADDGRGLAEASPDFKFAAAVAEFGMLLRRSPHAGTADFGQVLELALQGLAEDRRGRRAEFIDLVRRAVSARHR